MRALGADESIVIHVAIGDGVVLSTYSFSQILSVLVRIKHHLSGLIIRLAVGAPQLLLLLLAQP